MSSSHLLNLAAELRAKIFELVFPEQLVLTSTASQYTTSPRHHVLVKVNPSRFLAITEVNKQLRDEALKTFWSTTTFTFYHPEERGASAIDEAIYRWLTTPALGESVHHIRCLRFVCIRSFKGCEGVQFRHTWALAIAVNLSKQKPEDAINLTDHSDSAGTLGTADESHVCSAESNSELHSELEALRKVIASIPRDGHDGTPIVTQGTIWSLWESLYQPPISNSDKNKEDFKHRSWDHFAEVYEFNQQKETPQPWNESTYYKSNLEMESGLPWDEYIRTKMKKEKEKLNVPEAQRERCVVS